MKFDETHLAYGMVAVALSLFAVLLWKVVRRENRQPKSEPSTAGNAPSVVFLLLICSGGGWYYFTHMPAPPPPAPLIDMAEIHRQVAADAIRQYEIVKRTGSGPDIYVRAGLVAEAYLQAHDEPNYRKWKQTQREISGNYRLGLP